MHLPRASLKLYLIYMQITNIVKRKAAKKAWVYICCCARGRFTSEKGWRREKNEYRIEQ